MAYLHSIHTSAKDVSAKLLFKGEEATVTALQINADDVLKEHITKVPALLICVQGEVIFENEEGIKCNLHSGEFYLIEPFVKHWVRGVANSQLVLCK